jgi:acyl-ACP thioesterase
MWILSRFRLRMERYPREGDSVTVETWASPRTNGIRAVRHFLFLDANGDTLGRASSIFLMMDSNRKRPVRLPPVVLALAHHERPDSDEFEMPRLQPPENPGRQRVLAVGWRDLDANEHANNVSYVEWALEALPLEINRDRMLAQFDIEFLAEAFYGDQVIADVEVTGSICRHQLKNSAGSVVALAVSRWSP